MLRLHRNFASRFIVQADTQATGNEPADEPIGYVYVLGTLTPRGTRTYVGWTFDPSRRLGQHNGGTGAKSTRGHQWSLLYIEKLATRVDAMSREWHLKRDHRFRSQLARNLQDA